MSDRNPRRAFDAGEYDAGYSAGVEAWYEAERLYPGRGDEDPPLPDGTKRYQDGFEAGWGDALAGMAEER